jgi:hypothetical protein
MYRFILFLLFLLTPVHFSSTTSRVEAADNQLSGSMQLYMDMQLFDRVSYPAFEQALSGYEKIAHRKNIMTLIDFTKPSSEERLFVLDMDRRCLLYSSVVSHGRNSGANYATSFSNETGSYQSSLGFYVTENTYKGKNGYSLILDGLEKGFNDRAKERAIVIHGAAYSNPSVIANTGRLGRSQGCPALPEAVSAKIIDAIKGGSVLYIYADNSEYAQKSDFLHTNS